MIKKQYLCIVKNGTGGSVEKLDYGVMVTQQILVLFFQVRVLVVQLKVQKKTSAFFLLCILYKVWVLKKVKPEKLHLLCLFFDGFVDYRNFLGNQF